MLGAPVKNHISLSGASTASLAGACQTTSFPVASPAALSTTGQATQLHLPSAVDAVAAAADRQGSSATPTATDISNLLSRYRSLNSGGVSADGGGVGGPSSLGAASPSIDPALLRALIGQQQGLQSQQNQLTSFQNSAAGAATAAFGSSTGNAAPSPASSMGLAVPFLSGTSSTGRPVHFVVHHHHDGPAPAPGEQQGAALGATAAAPVSIQAALARQLNLPNRGASLSTIGNLSVSRSPMDPSL